MLVAHGSSQREQAAPSLNLQDLITLGDIIDPKCSFCAAVKAAQIDIDETFRGISGGKVDSDHDALHYFRNHFAYMSQPKGFGYVASSLSSDIGCEIAYSALIAQDISSVVTSLVVSIDDLYRFNKISQITGTVSTPSIVNKITTINDLRPNTLNGKPIGVIVTNFASSSLFDDETLGLVPSQEALGASTFGTSDGPAKECCNALFQFTGVPLTRLISETASLGDAVVKLSEQTGESVKACKVVLATALLLQDRQMWQNLWYERKSSGTPLVIVAPATFHYAMNRLNECWGHAARDYEYRAKCSLGAFNEPPFILDEKKKVINRDLIVKKRKTKPEFLAAPEGPTAQAFAELTWPVLSRL